MNLKTVLTLGAAVGMVISGLVIESSMKKGYDHDVNNALDISVNKKFGDDIKAAKNELAIANAEAKKLYSAEIEETKNRLLANEEYQQAKLAATTTKDQLDILKKSLKEAKNGNTTSVSVGTGDSNVAVSIKDTSRIAQLESDISRVQAENKAALDKSTRFWRIEREKVVSERTAEDIKIVDAVKNADKALTKVDFESKFYRNQLIEDNNFMENVSAEAYLKNYKPLPQLASTIFISVPVVCLLGSLWISTGKALKLYFDLKKGAR